MREWIAELIPFALGVVFGAGGLVVLLNALRRDVNGLGKKQNRHVACDLRCAAEEEPISKAKLLHIADVLDPR